MKINLELHEKHLERIKSFKPVNALKEMIWNAFDADAKNITIKVKRDYYNALKEPVISEIIVADDGIGLALDVSDLAFRNFGYSSKSNGNKKSPSGRRMHGSKGEGRYSLFSIGSDIRWFSVYSSEGINKSIVITFDPANRGKIIDVSDAKITNDRNGMTITIGAITPEAEHVFEKRENVIAELLKEFATCLLAYKDIKIVYDNTTLNIDDAISLQKVYSSQVQGKIVNVLAVEWKSSSVPTIYYCDESGIPLEEGQKKSKYNLSIYVSAKAISDLKENCSLIDGDMIPDEIKEIKTFADECIDDFEMLIITRDENALIDSLKDDDVYPFTGEPLDLIDKHNRSVFDSVVIELNKKVGSIRKSPKKEQKLMNNLLAETIKNSPSSLKTIINKVLDLTKEEQDKFAKILDQIQLSQIIKTIESVVDRIKFLDMMNDMIYTDIGKGIKERTEFQKILLNQLWIFGEQYAYFVSDRNVRNVLAKFSNIFERDEIENGEIENGELIPDICLFGDRANNDSEYEHLVVEIKKPTKTLTLKEYTQITTYASTISSQPQFTNGGHRWTFLLVGRDIDKALKLSINQSLNGTSNAVNPVIKVSAWEDIIKKTKFQYEYFKKQLELNFSNDEINSAINSKLDEIRTNDRNK